MTAFKDISHAEQYREAKKHTSVEAYRKKPYLAMTCYDHIIVGGTPLTRMLEQPDKSLAELMTRQEISDFLDRQIEASHLGDRVVFERILRERVREKDMSCSLVQDILYLFEIGKLPEKYRKKFFDEQSQD